MKRLAKDVQTHKQQHWVQNLRTTERMRYALEFLLVKIIFSAVNLLPFRSRRSLMGSVFAFVIAPVAGYRTRIRNNLDLIWPQLDQDRKAALAVDTAKNIGRTVCEILSPMDLLDLARQTEITGAGLGALEEARKTGQPAIIVSGHFGNYDLVRASLIHHGFNVGALYRRMNNPYFQDFYIDKISQTGTPLFERGRPGLSQMVKHLKGGGTVAALIDVRARNGESIPFLGKPARISPSMAELALRYNAILIPFFGTRLSDSQGFTAVLDAPIPHTDPKTMTRALTYALERRVCSNPEQWFWIHNLWRVP